MRKLGIGHVYDIMESVSDAGERLETVLNVESARGCPVSGICGAATVCVWFHAFSCWRPCESCDTVT